MKRLFFSLAFFSFFLSPDIASAHAFGKTYYLPLPAWLYFYGGGAIVVVSFLLVGIFIREQSGVVSYAKIKLRGFNFLLKQYTKIVFKLVSLFIFFLSLFAGFFGQQVDADSNLLIIVFWIYLLLGLLYASGMFGNFWQIINPLAVLSDVLLAIQGKRRFIKYPSWLSYFPAFFLFVGIVWLELLSSGWAIVPWHLALLISIYSLITFVGVFLFGKDAWFGKAAVFSVIFSIISKLSLFIKEKNTVVLRPPFVGALEYEISHVSLLILIISMLAATAYDGFRATAIFAGIDSALQDSLSSFWYQIAQTVTLFIAILFFVLLYFLAIGAVKIFVKTKKSVLELALAFGYSLTPIVLAYNIAHYFTLLLVQGQSLIPLLSDPLNQGLNLFGTRDFEPNTAVMSAGAIWNSQVAIIVVGHIIAVYLAHRQSLLVFLKRKQALLSQLPMLVLMVCYTITGLWILSQPLGTK